MELSNVKNKIKHISLIYFILYNFICVGQNVRAHKYENVFSIIGEYTGNNIVLLPPNDSININEIVKNVSISNKINLSTFKDSNSLIIDLCSENLALGEKIWINISTKLNYYPIVENIFVLHPGFDTIKPKKSTEYDGDYTKKVWFYKTTSIIVNAKYKGNNLLIENPSAANNIGNCVVKVLVNGVINPAKINKDYFEIEIDKNNVKFNDDVEIIIYHKLGCEPKFVNPEVLGLKLNYPFYLDN